MGGCRTKGWPVVGVFTTPGWTLALRVGRTPARSREAREREMDTSTRQFDPVLSWELDGVRVTRRRAQVLLAEIGGVELQGGAIEWWDGGKAT